MKRSEINAQIREALALTESLGFCLPPFARWTPEDWAQKGPECDEIRRRMLGWDVTDYGQGDFDRLGLLLFTLRNGDKADPAGKTYCEKILISKEGQDSPDHFHWEKIEDIIVRGGGNLRIRLYNADEAGGHADTDIAVSTDGTRRVLKAGTVLCLHPGESITLTPGLYHEFWADPGYGTVLLGEVSKVNDDRGDNRFYAPIGRFPAVEEDVPAEHLLCFEYPETK